MPLIILSVLFQTAFVIHVLKTGRDTKWIWIIMMLPMAGIIAYLLLEVMPDVSNSRAGRKVGKKVDTLINPNRDINEAIKNYSKSDSVQNTVDLAKECLGKNMYQEAKELYSKCLSGPFSDDPELLSGLAKAEFCLENYQASKDNLDRLIEAHPDYKNQDCHLLYARALEALGDKTAAQHEYETLYSYFSGPEAIYYFAHFLKKSGKTEKAKALFQEIVTKSKEFGRHYNDLYKDYIKSSKQESSR